MRQINIALKKLHHTEKWSLDPIVSAFHLQLNFRATYMVKNVLKQKETFHPFFFLWEGRRMNNFMFCNMHEPQGSAQQYLSPEESQGKCIYNCNFLLDCDSTYLRLGEKKGTWFRKKITVLTLNILLFKCSALKVFPFKSKAISHIGKRPTVCSPLSKTKCGFLTRYDIKSQDHFSFFQYLKSPFLPMVPQKLKRQTKPVQLTTEKSCFRHKCST